MTGNVRPARELQRAIDEPGHPESWKMIQKQAAKNAALYEAAFPFVPRSFVKNSLNEVITAKIIPTWDTEAISPKGAKWKKGNLSSPMPYQENFWNAPQHTAEASHLSEIKGFITALPVEWTKDENVRIPFPSAMVVQNDVIKNSLPNTPKTVLGAIDKNPDEQGKGQG